MTFFQLIGLIISFMATAQGAVLRVNGSDEYKLRRELFKDVDVMVRPVENNAFAVNVSFSLTVSKLMDLDNKRQVLTTRVWISQRWKNPFITWAKEDHSGIDRIEVSPSQMWVPDIVLYNNAGKQVLLANHADQYMIKSLVTLYNDGTCLWDSLAILESSCDVDVTSFPFSKQECHLIFTSGKYDSRLMDIHPMPSSTEENNSVQNATVNSTLEWEVEVVITQVHRQLIQRHSGLSAQEYVTLRYTVVMQRKSTYYVMYLIVPCVLCTVLVLISFAIPPENGERIGFCSTVMLSVSVYLLLIADLLPDNSDALPILGIYYTMTMVEIALALVATILVLRAYHSASEPPSCVKALYNTCKARKNKKRGGKSQKAPKRNAVGSELPEVESVTMANSKPLARVDGEQNKFSLEEDENSETENRKIWRSVAVFFDRVFFWLFAAMFIVSTAFLIKAPISHRSWLSV